MLNCAEQVQIQKYITQAYKTLKTVGVLTTAVLSVAHQCRGDRYATGGKIPSNNKDPREGQL